VTHRPAPRRGRARRGLSLLEVMLALVMLIIAVAAISALVDMGTNRGLDARNTMRGTRLAQSVMAQVEAGLLSVSGSSSGQFTDDDSAWSYQVTSQSVSQPAAPQNLYIVTVTVTRSPNVSISLTQMMIDPQYTGSSAQGEATSEATGPIADSTSGSTGSTGSSGTGSSGSSGSGSSGGTAP
jgi:general secretion pathway protein I